MQHLELRNRVPREPDWPRQDLYVTFRREIAPEVEANLLAIPRKQRAMVRKGISAPVALPRSMRGADRFFDCMPTTSIATARRRSRDATSTRCSRRSATTARSRSCFSPQGKPVSGVLSFYFRDEVLPYYAGDLADARELAANDFKYWDLMRRACERGLRVFDYGRSKRGTGSFDFKKNWGFEPQPLHYEHFFSRATRSRRTTRRTPSTGQRSTSGGGCPRRGQR